MKGWCAKMEKAEIWAYLMGCTGNPYATAGIMGNLYAESMLIANNLQNTFETKLGMTDVEYTQRVDDGTYSNFVKDGAGYGLAQFTFWTLKRDLLAYAKSENKSVGDAEMQLDFLINTLQTGEFKGLWSDLENSTSVEDATKSFLYQFERPNGYDTNPQILADRTHYAQVFFDELAVYYRVQTGAFWLKENAERYAEGMRSEGYETVIVEVKVNE